jgi:hypothetical protein
MLKKSKTSAEKENNKKDYRKIKSEVIMNSDIGKIKTKFVKNILKNSSKIFNEIFIKFNHSKNKSLFFFRL